MELVLALIAFAILIVAWIMLPGTGAAALTTEETQAWKPGEALATTEA